MKKRRITKKESRKLYHKLTSSERKRLERLADMFEKDKKFTKYLKKKLKKVI